MKCNRTHPCTVLEYFSKLIFLIFIPVSQQLILYVKDSIRPMESTFIYAPFLSVILILSIYNYRNDYYCVYNKSMYKQNGILSKHSYEILTENIRMVSTKNTLLYSLFSATKLQIHTKSISKKSPGISIIMPRKALKNAISLTFKPDNINGFYKISIFKVLLMSVFWTNPASGLLIAAPLIKKAGTIFGDTVSKGVYSTYSFWVQVLSVSIHPAMSILSYLLISGWIISFLIQFTQYLRFSIAIYGNDVMITKGMINESILIFNINAINSVKIRQNPLMKIFKVYIINLTINNSPREKDIFIPVTSFDKLEYLLDKFRSGITPNKPDKSIKPNSFLYLHLPLFVMILISIIFITNPTFIGIILLIIVSYWFFARTITYKVSSISTYNDLVAIKSFKKFSLVSEIINFNKIELIKIKQNLLQKGHNRCNLKIYTHLEKRPYIALKHLNYSFVENLVENVEISLKHPKTLDVFDKN